MKKKYELNNCIERKRKTFVSFHLRKIFFLNMVKLPVTF